MTSVKPNKYIIRVTYRKKYNHIIEIYRVLLKSDTTYIYGSNQSNESGSNI